MAEKKNEMLKEVIAKELAIGDKVIVKKGLFDVYARNPDGDENCIITNIIGDGKYEVTINTNEDWRRKSIVLSENDMKRDLFDVGANPFPEKPWNSRITYSAFSIEGILSLIGESSRLFDVELKISRAKDNYVVNGIKALECNFNPYVEKNGEKLYYQRDYCWTLNDKQLFIESIYQSMNCGTVLLRERSFKWVDNELKKGNTEAGFFDVVDGKQRLSCLIEFVNDKFKDMHGNYYSDLSNRAQWRFRDSRSLNFGQMHSGSTDEEAIEAFLHVNFHGIPMSKEHIDYVKEIHNKIKSVC